MTVNAFSAGNTILRRLGLLGSAALLLATASCTTLEEGFGLSDADLTTGYSATRPPVTFETAQAQDPQSRIGRSQHPKILAAYGGAYSDPKVERMLAGVVGKLQAASQDPNRAYNITVLNSPNVNAFALPGGYVYITRGLLALANDSAEVAAVIGHEMAHVSANHGIERQQREREAEIASRVVSEVLASDKAGRIAVARNKLSVAQFSRQQELEADVLGIKHIGRAGFDPYAASRFLAAMDAYTSFRNAFQVENPSLDFLASHPSAPQRIELARRHAREQGPPGVGSADRDRYLAGIDGILFGDSASEGYVRGRKFYHPGLGIAFDVPENFVIDNTSEAVLATGPGDVAIRFDGVALAPSARLEDYIASGWVGGLDRSTIRRRQLGGLEAVSARATGGDYAFDVTVVRVGKQVYRFLTAVPADNAGRVAGIAESVSSSFRMLSAAERNSLKPLRIRVVTAASGDSVDSIASRMVGVDRPAGLFRLLNGLDAAGTVQPGARYKIVAE
ncbi:M48 family metalloprotease [Fulvimarina sp. 2208YS6-2-32]|uniref:M48 family metalloprotease n=1 Tax=Fulvimarina uroteuthidis TaxID=3098149 RepID=A0ABU5I6L8_9HYPH|nr:M48 family metalloprotease [Fulvimarina sp. 2208YS6-2-32]MDY8111019.1 M48 family metalloprotease [Fulvimarina sp. 2208YS6-2-32]